MEIGIPRVDIDTNHATWKVAVADAPGAPDHLWFRVPREHGEMLTHRADPALIALIVPAMRRSESLHVKGPITDELVHGMRNGYQHIVEHVIEGMQIIPISTDHEIPVRTPGAGGVGTGFSAGIDSFAVVVDYHLRDVPPSLRLTHLTLFNVGSHGRGEAGREIFEKRLERLRPAALDLGLPLVPVDSNLDDFYDGMKFQQTNGPRTIAAAAVLQEAIGRYYFASSFPFEHVRIQRSHDTAFSDPVSLPLLSTAGFNAIPHGEQYTRVEKTRLILHCPETRTHLDVCVTPLHDASNCSRCMKCLRTQLTLDLFGELQDFRKVFDLDVYRSHRAAYLDEVAISSDEFAIEIRQYADSIDYEFPGRLGAHARQGGRLLMRKQRGARRRISQRLGSNRM